MSPANTLAKIVKRNGQVVPFDKEKIVNAIFRAAVEVGGHDRRLAEILAEKVVHQLELSKQPPALPSVEEVQDIIEKELIESGHAKTAKKFILYRYDHNKLRQGVEKQSSASSGNIPYKKIWQVLSWAVDHNCYSVEKINEHIEKGTYPQLVADVTAKYDADIASAAEKIIARLPEVRIVIIAGPSSSGKTTTTIKVGEHLQRQGYELVSMELDMYYFNLEHHPRDEFGDYDFETPEALDLALINQHLADLLAGKTIQMPRYNFKTGKREAETDPMKLEKNQILLLDSLHGLYAPMTNSVSDEKKFKLYIETLCQIKNNAGEFIRWTDVRLLRRMVRDSWHRSYNPRQTLEHWHYVRRSEIQHIIPFLGTVDHVIDGSLPYELPIYKKHLFHHFPDFVKDYREDPKRQDAYIRAKRVHDLLESFKTWENEDVIPKDVLIREYIGGSIYEY
ncbi:MAG: response regulator SirA [Candidatus Riflebacteria bacterium HGW-Riflebacteria-1]|jgi:uridine kinase|nr:MAG: response regulator SirA [Candidatus Riflebacteria bacterium HGW-Riflebacteria-1]